MNRKQFLLTKNKGNFPNLDETQKIGDYFLYLGKDSEYCYVKNENGEFHLLGSMYDWEITQHSNKQILENISRKKVLDEVLKIADNYCGEFVLIVKLLDEILILNDAAGQKEVYYDNEFACFGTQPKLLGLATKLLEHVSEDAVEYYNSQIFNEKGLFVGNTTHKRNIYHLLPNHFLSIKEKSTHRFFPSEALENNSMEYVAQKSSGMLKGYISAISKRNILKMAVTGGYDSRLLFLASLNIECEYFVSKYPYMNDSHHDILIPKRLTSYFNKDFKIEVDENILIKTFTNTDYTNDIDFPRFLNLKKYSNDVTYLNGNISETARNYYGYLNNATAGDLCFMSGNSTSSYATKQYYHWLKNKSVFEKYGYHYLDMFYWEERMGNWAAKFKTESHALEVDFISPFNSRELLKLLLSTKRKNRDSHFNRLYDLIIYELSGQDDNIARLEINPCKRQKIIRLMKYFRIYNLYWYIGIKTKTLNF